MQRKFVSNLFLVVVLNLLVKPVSLFWIDAGVQNRVGAEDYGTYYVLLNITVLFNILLDLGINNFTTRNIAQYPHLANRYFSKIVTFRLLAFVAYVLCTIPLVLLLDLNHKGYHMLAFLLFNQLLIGLIAYARAHFGGMLLFRWDALFSVLDRLLLIIFCGGLFLFSSKEFEVEWFVYSLTGAYLLTTILAYAVLTRKIGRPSFKLDFIFLVSIVKRSLPFAVLILLMMIYTRIDSFMIALLDPNSDYEVGIYAFGFRILDAFFMFAMLFAGLLLPIFSKQIHDRDGNFKLMILSSKLLIGGAILLAWLCQYHGEEILSWVYTDHIKESAPAFKVLMLSFVPICVMLLNSTLLTAFGEMRKLNILAGFSILLNIVLNLYWIPRKGAEGAAWATLLTQSVVALVHFYYCHVYFDNKKYPLFALNLVLLGVVLGFIGPFLVQLKLSLIYWMALGILLMFATKIWQPRSWLLMLKTVKKNPELEETA